MDKLLLVDGHSILNRAFYGLPDLTNSKGQHTNAVLGFVNMVEKVIEEEQPTHFAVAFDLHEPTFRHKMYDAYKGTRKGMPDELRSQVPLVKELLKTMHVTVMECPGFEADDIIGTMSRWGEKLGMQVTILSGDRDLLQLATDRILVRIPKTKAGHTTVENYYAKDVEALYGVTPVEFIDMKGLMGDTSDNIPGVPGIGEKTASAIISTYHSIENAYAHIEELKPKKARENLGLFYDQALMSKTLATIKLDVPISADAQTMRFDTLFTQEAYDSVKQLELKSLLKYYDTPHEEKTLDFHVDCILDLGEMETFFSTFPNCERMSLHVVIEKGSMIGAAVSTDGYKVTLIGCSLFITEDLLADRFLTLAASHPAMEILTNDLKTVLHHIPFREETHLQDCSIAAYILNPITDSYFYDDIARDYLELTVPSRKEMLDKTELSVFVFPEVQIQKYLAYETLIPFLAWNGIRERLQEGNMWELYDKIERPTVYVLTHMETEGVRIDAAALREYGAMLGKRVEALEQAIYTQAGMQFNINSPKQLGEVLFEKLQLEGGKKTKRGYSTNVDVLNKLRKDHKIVEDILEYRQVAKLKSTYADGLGGFVREDGRIHGTFNQTITATGRISSTEPNLQNIPMRTELGREIRKVFIPKDGYVFVDADYSQIELRVLAHFSGDDRLIEAYKEHKDIHAITASQVFGVPLEQVDDRMRRNAKAVNFGIVYGISAFGLAEDLQISRKEASDYIDGYFATYPGVKRFMDETVENARKTGVTHTMFGRVRQIPELASSNFMQRSFGERIAMNSPIQGTAADIIKIAMIRVDRRLKEEQLRSSLILQIHDELLIETHVEEVELVTQILREEMMHAAELRVPLEVGISSGNSWYEAK